MLRNHLFRLTSLLALTLGACVPSVPEVALTPSNPPTTAPAATQTINPGNVPGANATASQKPRALVPEFQYILTVVFENREFGTVVNNRQMSYFNELAKSHTLLSQYYAVTHPSLPNYLALLSGQTFGLTSDCTTCVYDAPSLPDLIEASGRTWKAYEEDMPSSCFLGAETANYAMKHNPFVYLAAIRTDVARCKRAVVPMDQFYTDLANKNLPNYSFITPNICNDAHDCALGIADGWLKKLMLTLLPALDAQAKPYLVVITWDEGQGLHSCCGLPLAAGGRVATILVSPQARSGFEDATPYSHYSILKTISESWHLAYLGHAADPATSLIIAPWK